MRTTQSKVAPDTAWSFRLPADLLERFKEAARAENRTAAGALRNLMEQHVAEHEAEDRQPLDQGRASVA
jgi:predicted DNA-binding protein